MTLDSATRFAQAGATAEAAEETDVVIVGAGGAGLPAALFARALGDEVVLLEKAATVGGTARRSGFGIWIPANESMRAEGTADPREDYLRFVARVSRPERYHTEGPRFGLTEWEYDMVSAIYDTADAAVRQLCDLTGLRFEIHNTLSPEYYGELDECTPKSGRSLSPKGAFGPSSNGGDLVVSRMVESAAAHGVGVRTGHPVTGLLVEDGAVVGVEVDRGDGPVPLRARKAVIVASGGFSADPGLREAYLGAPTVRGCAVDTNQGDFLRLSVGLEVDLHNMAHAWMCPVSLDKSADPTIERPSAFFLGGDSMLAVNRYGRRVTNEKLPYNELAQAFGVWDPIRCEYPNRVLVQIWDQRSHTHSGGRAGALIPGPGEPAEHVLRADTLSGLAEAIDARLALHAATTGGVRLADGFGAELAASIRRFNDLARSGTDEDFHRGRAPIDRALNGVVREEPGRRNPTMWPLSDEGPYYAALLAAGTLDTKGGPRTSADGEVLDRAGHPIAGLYGVGNCVAAPSGRAYWGAGATLGPILAYAYRAARSAHARPPRSVTGRRSPQERQQR